MSHLIFRSVLAGALALLTAHALAQSAASAPVASPVAPPAVIASAPLAPASAAAAASAPTQVVETTDPARANSALKRAEAIGDRNASVARTGSPPPSAVLLRAKTDDGYAYLSGGVTVGDRRTMRAERADYTLWVATVAKPSGAFLSDAQLVITRAGDKQPLFERTMDGPWMMLALPPGRYEVKATLAGEASGAPRVVKEVVSVAKQGVRQSVLRFDSSAQMSPEGQDPEDAKLIGTAPPAKKK